MWRRIAFNHLWKRCGECHTNILRQRNRTIFTWRPTHQTSVRHIFIPGVLAGILCGGLLYAKGKRLTDAKDSVSDTETPNVLKTFSQEEVSKHDSPEKGLWVTYDGSVYDITDYVASHPGGVDRIMMAGGGSIEMYWSFYPVHKNQTILDVLNRYHIGYLTDEDRETVTDFEDLYKDDPSRHPSLVPWSIKPYIAEASVELLLANYITPNELHYVRNHMPVPIVTADEYELSLSGGGVREMKLSLKELKTKFKKHTVIVTLHCAGNRSDEMDKARKIIGLPSGSGNISTAEWSGVLLKDVLEYAGLDDQVMNTSQIKHVQFEGLDLDIADTSYGASIPVHKAMDPQGDVLLAYEMNGEDLPPDHGYPVRVIAPGIAGCRSVKWLGKIIVSEGESESFWQQKIYKGCPPNIDTESLDYTPFPAIQELPVTSAICYPKENQVVSCADGTITVKGYAWSGGGRTIFRVDLSIDGGKTWIVANLRRREQPPKRQWAWTLWECDVPIPVDGNKLELVCKAVDSSYNTQPETTLPIWNPRGYLSHAWSRVNVYLENKKQF